jgi:hypothetical protein
MKARRLLRSSRNQGKDDRVRKEMLSVAATREGRMLQCQHIKLMAQTPSMLLERAWSLWYKESLARSIATNQDGTSHDITQAKLCRCSFVVLQLNNVSIMLVQYQTLVLMPELRLKYTFASLPPRLVKSKTLLTLTTYANLFLMPAMKLFTVMMVKLYAFMPTKIMMMNMVARDTRK